MDVLKRVPVREQDPKVRATNFEEVCLGYNQEEAQEEAMKYMKTRKNSLKKQFMNGRSNSLRKPNATMTCVVGKLSKNMKENKSTVAIH